MDCLEQLVGFGPQLLELVRQAGGQLVLAGSAVVSGLGAEFPAAQQRVREADGVAAKKRDEVGARGDRFELGPDRRVGGGLLAGGEEGAGRDLLLGDEV